MLENRGYKRFRLDRGVNVKMLLATELKVIDISISGISLKANRRLNIGSDYTLKLEGGETITLRGTVIWSSLSETRSGFKDNIIPMYLAGMQFKDMSAEGVTKLQTFIEHRKKFEDHKKEEVHALSGDRLNVRFHLDDKDTAVLNVPSSYKVREISLGGMLIECPQDFAIGSTIPMSLSLYDDKLVKIMGRVASCRGEYSDGQKHYAIGIEFLDLTDKDREVLATFIPCCTFMEDRKTEDKNVNKTSSENIPAISQEFIDKVEHFYRWHDTMGYYKVLGVKEWATDQQIKHAFFTMAKEFHPDKYHMAPDDLKQKLKELFSYLNAGRLTLLDAQKRAEYDRMTNSRIK